MIDDPSTEQRLMLVYPDVAVRWRRLREDLFTLHGYQIRVAQGIRTFAEQQAIYEKGRKLVDQSWIPLDPVHHQGIVTWAHPGDSWHHYSAIDSCFAGPDPYLEKMGSGRDFMWSEYGRLGKAHGFTWGGDWEGKKNDRPHLEMTYSISLAEAKSLYKVGGLKAVWARFDQVRGVPPGSEWDQVLSKVQVLSLGDLPPSLEPQAIC